MKKSLLIVPAMATMLLAAAGSVGGTVAWFSANTTFNTNVSSFKVVRLDGDLQCTLTPKADAGTVAGASSNTVKVNENTELTHGSFDHNGGKVFTQISEGTYSQRGGINPSDGTVISTLLAGTYKISDTTHYVYHAVAWDMTFTYHLPVEATTAPKTNLYFNLASSNVEASTDSTPEGAESRETSKGFRIAFFPQSSNKTASNQVSTHVWAYLQESSKCKYVKDVSGTPTGASAYTGTELLYSGITAGASVGDLNGSTSANNYLGQFAGFDDGDSYITFTCVAWFEGEDENVVNKSKMQTVSAALAFFTLPDSGV